MERPARMTRQPLTDLGMLVGGVIVRDGMDELTGRHRRLDCVEEADELLMPMLLHTSTDDRAIQHVEGCEQRGGAVSDVVVRHSATAALLHWQAWLGAIERLYLDFLVDRVGLYMDPMSLSLAANCGSLDSLNRRVRCGCKPCLRQMRCTELTLMPWTLAVAAAVQCVVSPAGSARVAETTRAATSASRGG